jgi:hypothetical protein
MPQRVDGSPGKARTRLATIKYRDALSLIPVPFLPKEILVRLWSYQAHRDVRPDTGVRRETNCINFKVAGPLSTTIADTGKLENNFPRGAGVLEENYIDKYIDIAGLLSLDAHVLHAKTSGGREGG